MQLWRNSTLLLLPVDSRVLREDNELMRKTTTNGTGLSRWPHSFVRLAFAIVFVILFSAFSYAQKISAEEQQLVDYIDVHTNEAIALLEKTVNIESPTENLAGVKQVGTVFQGAFESLGFTAKWISMPPEMKRAGHLLAEKTGSKGKRILLLGHLDTVLSGERFRREGNKAFGTGSSDMKAGDVVLYLALKALHDTGALKDASVIVLLTGDEEDSGDPVEVSRGDMIAVAKRSDLALSFENGGSNIATVARRGSSDWLLEVTARTGHSSQIFKSSMGNGAIFEAARARMREIVARSLPGTSAKITFFDGIPSMPPTEGNYQLLKQLDAVSQDLGFGKIEALGPGERGAGDVAYVTHLIPGLDGLGATGGGAHARGEYADLGTLPRQIKRAAVLIYRLTR
jgi:hypothetical protein